jgi:hypothetical protein
VTRSRRRAVALVTVIAVVIAAFATAAAAHAPTVARRSVPSLRPVDGGADYAAKFSPSLPTDPSYFPIGVWFESVTQRSDVTEDRAAGLNTYVQLTDTSSLPMIRRAGMHVITGGPLADSGSELVGWIISDEADMRYGPGWGSVVPQDGDFACAPSGTDCGFTAQQTRRSQLPDDHRLRYSNYGKGITFWESDRDARVFVNRFQDVVSADNYWFTDPNICGASEGGALLGHGQALPAAECRRASNYGATIDRLRSLVRPAGSKPVWAFVEVGHPFTDDDAPTIRPAEVRAAVWSSLIHGARGVIYFNHSFGGQCQTQHALREPCYADVRAEVTSTNAQITALAPVLNAPTVVGATRTKGAVDTLTKWSGDHYYVFAGSRDPNGQSVTFDLTCTRDAVATVLGENRTVPITGGTFSDTFADGNAVHLYRIDGGSTCLPRGSGASSGSSTNSSSPSSS